MFYTVYLLEDQHNKSRYIGFTNNLKKRIENHRLKRVITTRNKKDLTVIYAEFYLNQKDARGRERFLKNNFEII